MVRIKPSGAQTSSSSVSSPWSLQDSAGTTTAGGQFATTFLPTTTAGTATITATVTVPGTTTAPVVQTYSQNISADIPASGTNSYQGSASVGSITDITIRVTDKNGNPVNSKKKKNLVTFTTTPAGNNGFLAPSPVATNALPGTAKTKVKTLAVALNDSGYADVNFVLNTGPGDNYVLIAPPSPLMSTLIDIQGLPNLPPSSITQTISPGGNPPTLITDGTSKFTINYRLTDIFGNPSTFQNLSITTSAGESKLVVSNNQGLVTISYGPKTMAGRYTITATSPDNPKVSVVQTVQFLSGNPTNMLLTASPQSMASLDVDPSAAANVRAKVIDNQGNPVAGQPVYFSLPSVTTGSCIQTQGPSLAGASGVKTTNSNEIPVITDSNGYASATFTPGAFTTDTNNPGFSLTASGTALVKARWTGIISTISLSYKNYPYLSVYTSVDPATIATNSTVNVSIQVKGDGYALKPKPVDAYMVTDRSGSMSTVDTGNSQSRIALVKNAASGFADLFDYSVDRLGQFSFGDDTYFSADVTLDQALTNQPGQIDAAISTLQAAGNTPMRLALYQAITNLKNTGNSKSVKALVVLSDGDYNDYGDPLARVTNDGNHGRDPTDSNYYYDDTPYWYKFNVNGVPENMSEYARENNIRIYTIGYSNSITTSGQATLQTLAETASGKYYYAMTNADLVTFYSQIAGALKDTAGVNTTLALNFTSVDVNGVHNTSVSKVLQYVYINGISTRVTQPDGTSVTVDSTADWNSGRINVTMGTIKVNQVWTVNFTLKALATGNISSLAPAPRPSSRISTVSRARPPCRTPISPSSRQGRTRG